MSYHPSLRNRGIRYREDTGLELRCDHCPKRERWWPLTSEFWDFRSFARCKACLSKQRRELNRRRYWRDEAVRLRAREYKKVYDQETKDARRIKNQAAYWADPERHRAAARERYYRNRDRILAQKKAVYWSEKAA